MLYLILVITSWSGR